MQETILTELALVILLGVIAAKVAEKFRIPTIVPLLLAGFIVGPQGFGLFDPALLGLSTVVAVMIFLPIIVFREGIYIDPAEIGEFRHSAFMFAVVMPIVTMLGITAMAHFLLGMPLFVSALLGAILAATDPSAVILIARRFRRGSKILSLIKVGACFDDAAAITLVNVAIAFALGTISFFEASAMFCKLFFGGLILGMAITVSFMKLIEYLKLEEHLTYLSIVLFVAVYSISETLGVSGIVACVVAGILVGRVLVDMERKGIDTAQMRGIWDALAFVGECLIFITLGAELDPNVLGSSVLLGLAFLAFFLVSRTLGSFCCTLRTPFSRGEKLFASFAGARGAVSAALAAFVSSYSIAGAEQVVGITMVVVFLSLFAISLSINPMAQKLLKLRPMPPEIEEYHALSSEHYLVGVALEELDLMFNEGRIDPELYKKLRDELRSQLKEIEERIAALGIKKEHLLPQTEKSIKRILLRKQLEALEHLKGHVPPSVVEKLARKLRRRMLELESSAE